ncbi:dihydrolipoamide acetyltransferase family protein [Geotalea uraniireducens]|uniref:Dihydrolipoamide acetyltransferase component of pyruvate dehydrogenase complex n=1 Tax=Geotalea uraniireducens (strain Rf4) TaxID=351605 RepID=A5GAC3_GEOUR|nr:dihydrolipoamide acetyltransferase family protein [Geotalea uraniireducens]ABQ25472.1 catalytic domain of components of various dehydrogenase complexes [Geotalea uraniireducens Rf4]
MSTEITMPKLSDTMTEGRLIAWKKSVGDWVERGDIIAEVETDKANMELEAFSAGVLLEIRVKSGEMVPVGTVIGIVGDAGEKVAEGVGAQPAQAAAETRQPPTAEPSPAEAAVGVVPERIMEPPEETAAAASIAEGGEKASPLVRRLAREKGIDLAQVTASGPEGRILQEDLERYQEARGARSEERGEGEKALVSAGAIQPLSRMRAAIARTVSDAWQSIPHFTVTVAIDMGEAENVYRELKGAGAMVSLNDVIIKAAAMVLQKFPLANASFAADGIVLHDEVNIGFAVSLDDGLLVPVIKGCGGLSLMEIAARSRELIERARGGTIAEADISGGTFSVSNLGMFGVEEFSAIIHPPQGAILAVGAVQDEAVVKGGQVVAARVMRATLSADHRLIDGAYAARFMAELKRVLENPVAMLV